MKLDGPFQGAVLGLVVAGLRREEPLEGQLHGGLGATAPPEFRETTYATLGFEVDSARIPGLSEFSEFSESGRILRNSRRDLKSVFLVSLESTVQLDTIFTRTEEISRETHYKTL